MTRTILITVVALSMGLPTATSQTVGPQGDDGRGGLTEEEKAVHVLNRLGYGPRPGDVERVLRMGVDAYVESQLQPWTLDDDPSLERQLANAPKVKMERVAQVIQNLVLPDSAVEIIGLARSSGRSFFLWGPPGNGKTTVGHLVHDAVEGNLWIPYCIGVGNAVIQFYDPQCHQRVDVDRHASFAHEH